MVKDKTAYFDKNSKMYKETVLDFSARDVKHRKKGIEEELSIFAPHASDHPTVNPEHDIKMERPVTPIDNEIKRQPHEWEQMDKYVRRRIAPDRKVDILSMEDQTDLSEILVAEVYHIWPEIKRQIDDPFLSWQENVELNRRIAVHIVTVCEQLYQHYLKKAQILMQRGVFSGPANMSRLKAQLGIEASKYLNVLTIRRYIVADMKELATEFTSTEDSSVIKKHGVRKAALPQLSYEGMLQKSRPQKIKSRDHWSQTRRDLKEIGENMPDLDTSKLMSVLAEMPKDLIEGYSGQANMAGPEPHRRPTYGSRDAEFKAQTSLDIRFDRPPLQRSNSSPQMYVSETLLQELGINVEDSHDRHRLSSEKKQYHGSYHVLYEGNNEMDSSKTVKNLSSRDLINLDLEKLTEVKPDPPLEQADDDMPPLLQAIIRHAKFDGMEEEHKKKIKELDEKERLDLEERSAPLQEPQHPQPATTAQKVPNKTIVRTSDIRVSERICMERITVKKHDTVYNDLLDEIDSTTVKNLDSNLFLGDEIREVYNEIMKTVPRDHLDCEQDELIERAPEDIDLSGLMASSSLTLRRARERIINPSLRSRHEAPWGSKEDKLEWSKTEYERIPDVPANRNMARAKIYEYIYNKRPLDPPKDSKGLPQFDPLVPSSENIAFAADPHSGKIGGISLSDLPVMVAERMTRAYASWLTWWKGTLNSDDYMKFLATKETDYLAVINHFYDSDAEDEDEEDSKSTNLEVLNKELDDQRTKKLQEMRIKKQEFTPGLWNVQSVLLGGLGRDPNVEDDDDIGRIRSAIEKEAAVSQTKKKVLGDIVKDRVKSGNMAASQTGGATPRTGRTSSRGAFTSRFESAISGTMSAKGEKKSAPSYQDRMEKVWNMLFIPDNMKLDMAIKYSSDAYTDTLEEVISAWEAATSLIIQREQIISELEAFERLASDPNRFFEAGYRGSSVARLKEAKLRNQLHSKLDNIHQRVEQAVKYVNDTYDDTITYQGRPYLEKMRWDKTEMLYWLQEERKEKALGLYNSLALKKQELVIPALLTPQS